MEHDAFHAGTALILISLVSIFISYITTAGGENKGCKIGEEIHEKKNIIIIKFTDILIWRH